MNKEKKFVNRKKVIIVTALALTVTIGASWTLAYFTDSQKVTNVITAAEGVDITLDEPHYNPDDTLNIVPADVISKDPTITNNLDAVYARLILNIQENDAGGADPIAITDRARAQKIMSMLYFNPNAGNGTPKDIDLPAVEKMTAAELANLKQPNPIFQLNPEFVLDNTRGGDGCYFFNYIGGVNNSGILLPGEVKTLFTDVVVPLDWDKSDILYPPVKNGDIGIGNFRIIVTAQAIQTQNFTGAEEAYEALDTYPPAD